MQQYKMKLINKNKPHTKNFNIFYSLSLTKYLIFYTIHTKEDVYTKKENRMKKVFIMLTLIWVAVIFSFSMQPGRLSGDLSGSILETVLGFFLPRILENPEQLELFHLIFRKCAHFTEFMILGVLSSIALSYMKLQNKRVCGLVFCVTVAALDEIIQLFVDGRAGRVQDVLIDGVGAFVGILIVVLCLRFQGEPKFT